nr:ribulose-phosphate 3-epimerase [Andalucia godoyi]
MSVYVAPSLLSADFGCLAGDSQRMLDLGAEWLHVDVMDGHFVPNLTIGAPVVAGLRKHLPSAFLDCHLMVSHPEKWVVDFVKAGASQFTFHLEAVEDRVLDIPGASPTVSHTTLTVVQLVHYIREVSQQKCKVGVALKPRTPVDRLFRYVEHLDFVLIMTVEPGFGGQSFMGDMVSKIRDLREYACANGRSDLVIGVDGGIDATTIEQCAEAGANAAVAGSAIFKAKDQKAVIDDLRSAMAKHSLRWK